MMRGSDTLAYGHLERGLWDMEDGWAEIGDTVIPSCIKNVVGRDLLGVWGPVAVNPEVFITLSGVTRGTRRRMKTSK
jgi:hypothetical protein